MRHSGWLRRYRRQVGYDRERAEERAANAYLEDEKLRIQTLKAEMELKYFVPPPVWVDGRLEWVSRG